VYVVEFTLHAKPGHYSDVTDLYSAFAADFLSTHDALVSVMVVGDEADGTVRGIGVWEDRESADAVNSDPAFAAFNDAIDPLLAEPAERTDLSLVHLFSRAD
jgi:quinol monooxygenase YgiN